MNLVTLVRKQPRWTRESSSSNNRAVLKSCHQSGVKFKGKSLNACIANVTRSCFSPRQPMKLGEHLNSLLLNMCDDVTLSRMSLRTVLDICSKHIRNSTCDPPFSYVRKLVRLVLGSLSQVQYLRLSAALQDTLRLLQ